MTDLHEHPAEVGPNPGDVFKKLALARNDVRTVAKTKTADTGKYEYHYATLADVLSAVDDALTSNGLQWSQHIIPCGEGAWQLMTTIIDVATGFALDFGGPIHPIKNDPQAMGSALTYSRRYALVTLLGMNVEDDDGGVAHRSAVDPENRTPAETKIRKWIKGIPDLMAKEDFQVAFVDEFGGGLTALPESKHGDALTWVVEYAKEHGLDAP